MANYKPCHFCDGKGCLDGGLEYGIHPITYPCYSCGCTGQLAEDWATLVELHPGCWVVKGNKTEEELKNVSLER